MEKQVKEVINPGVSRREFFKIGGTAAVSIALVTLPGCAKPSPEATTPQIPEQTPLANAEDLQTANANLTDSLNTVQSYAPEVFGGNGNDAQRTAISEFVANLKEAKQQIATAEAQIAAAEQPGDNAVTYSTEDLATLRQQVTAAEQVISGFTQKYHTEVIDSQGDWYGDPDYLAAHPDFITQLANGATIGTDAKTSYWNYRDQTPMRVFTDPNTGETTYTINLPEDADVKVNKYVPPTGGEWGQTTATGTVIKLGQIDIKEGGVDAGSPDVDMYAFDKPNVTPAEFAASIETTPVITAHGYYRTPSRQFEDLWVQSKEKAGFYQNAVWGYIDTGPGGWHNGDQVGQVTIDENANHSIDPIEFPADYGSEKCYQGGQAFSVNNRGEATMASTFTFLKGGSLEGEIPNLNDPAVRKLLIEQSDNANLHPVNVVEDGTIANIA